MSFTKDITLTIKDYTVTLSSSLKFYKNDSLKLQFSINEFGIEIKNGLKRLATMPINPLKAILLVENPDGIDHTEAINIIDNKVTFFLTDKYTKFVGITRLQIILKDNYNCRLTLPEFDMEIREPIANEGNSESICGEFLCGEIICGDISKQKTPKTIEIKRSLSDLFYEKFGGDF